MQNMTESKKNMLPMYKHSKNFSFRLARKVSQCLACIQIIHFYQKEVMFSIFQIPILDYPAVPIFLLISADEICHRKLN